MTTEELEWANDKLNHIMLFNGPANQRWRRRFGWFVVEAGNFKTMLPDDLILLGLLDSVDGDPMRIGVHTLIRANDRSRMISISRGLARQLMDDIFSEVPDALDHTDSFRIDERWRTSTVIDLARELRGHEICQECNPPGSGSSGVPAGDGLSRCAHCRGCGRTKSQFERMPILADALMDAGCDSQVVLDHCASGEFHCRGCWVIMGILGELQ